MPELKPVPVGWMTEAGRKLDDKPIQWSVFVGTKEHTIWKVGQVFTIDGDNTEYESLNAAVASLQSETQSIADRKSKLADYINQNTHSSTIEREQLRELEDQERKEREKAGEVMY
jgi:hypothetical protein